MTSVTIGNGVVSIGISAFAYYGGLTNIEFKGAKEQWKAILKDNEWNIKTGNYIVICSDGELDKNDNDIAQTFD